MKTRLIRQCELGKKLDRFNLHRLLALESDKIREFNVSVKRLAVIMAWYCLGDNDGCLTIDKGEIKLTGTIEFRWQAQAVTLDMVKFARALNHFDHSTELHELLEPFVLYACIGHATLSIEKNNLDFHSPDFRLYCERVDSDVWRIEYEIFFWVESQNEAVLKSR